MNDTSAKNRRIAKNTLMLYFRMLLMMGVTLYTSRVVLGALGVEDYGIYGVVGGVVAMFTMISGSLSSAISRYITFELGKSNKERLSTIFSTSVIIQLVIGVIIALLVESVGMWFLSHKMVIPAERLFAAKWVLQFSLITLIINLISIPYNAMIIAHERMSAFAYISILEALGKLVIAYLITIAPMDRLIFYSILMTAVALVVRMTYGAYCKRHFEESRFRLVFDKVLLKEMFSFAGWNFFGTTSALIRDQGGNIILNILGGGPVVNAARAIATQVNNAVVGFSTNFMMALNPQITKSYASGDRAHLLSLIFNGSRYSFYLLLTLSLPIFISTPQILALWLNVVPEYTVIFVQLALILGICDAISRPAITAILATGDIKKCQIIVGSIQLMNLPISYMLLKMGCAPSSVLVVAIVLILVCLMVRIIMLREMIGLSVRQFTHRVIVNAAAVAIFASATPYYLSEYMGEGFMGLVAKCAISILSALAAIYFVGCSRGEQEFLSRKVAELYRKVVKSN